MSIGTSASDFFIAGGTLRPDARSYVKRPADDELFRLALAGEFCYVLTPRQMGKSSLVPRTARRLQEQGVSTVIIDLTGIGTDVSVEQWYLGLIKRLKTQLKLSVDPDAWWSERATLSAVQRFTDFLRDVVLAEIGSPVVIFIDEIDTTLNLDFSDDFFAAIRFTYNARAIDSAYSRLTFVLLGVAAPSDLIKDPTRTPFNIGQEIVLRDFSRIEAAVLQAGLEAVHPGQGEAIFARIYHWARGHPYLTQRICQAVTRTEDKPWPDERIDELVEKLFLSKEASKEANLEFVRDRILTHPQKRQLLGTYRKVYTGKRIADDEQSLLQNHLKLSGLVKAEDGYLQVRNEIYRRVFNLAWVRENTAINWTRIGLIIATVIVLLLFGYNAHNAWVEDLVDASELKFYQATTSEERRVHLTNIFEPPGLFQVADYDYRARELFYHRLSGEEQIALFKVDRVKGADTEAKIIVLVRGLYTTLADTNSSDSTRPLLEAMVGALDELNETEKTDKLKEEIRSWLRGRELARQDKYTDARAEYDDAIALNGENPATLYERASVLIELSEYKQALRDLDQVMAIARRASAPPAVSATPTPLPSIGAITATSTSTATGTSIPGAVKTPIVGSSPGVTASPTSSSISTETPTPTATPTLDSIISEFATTGQMISAVRKMIYDGNPDLVSSLVSASSSEYPNLRAFGLVPMLTPTPVVSPTPSPAQVISPTFIPTPTSISMTTRTPSPDNVHLISDLQISNLTPLVGETITATLKVRNYGEQIFTARKFLVKGRGPDDSIQDFHPIDNLSLAPGAEYTYLSNRTFSSPGRYWFTPHYSPDGINEWYDITWADGRTSYVYINVVPDYPPRVALSVEPSTLYKGAEVVIKVTASDDIGLQSVRWWSVDTGDGSLDQGEEFAYGGGTGPFDRSWSRTWTGNKGKFNIYAEARDTANQQSSRASTMITVLPTEKFTLLSGGEPLADASVQVAMGRAINWAALREQVGEVVLVDFDSGETLAGPKEPEYDPDLARRLLTEAGHSRFDAVLLYDSGDEPSVELAEAVANYLNAVNISTQRRGVASANARTHFADMIAADESGFLIERRP